jgi:hypothetical protein
MTIYWKQTLVTLALIAAGVMLALHSKTIEPTSLALIFGGLLTAAKFGMSPIEGNPKTSIAPKAMPKDDDK